MIARIPWFDVSLFPFALGLFATLAVVAMAIAVGEGTADVAYGEIGQGFEHGPVFEELEESWRHGPYGRWRKVEPEFIPLVELTQAGVFWEGRLLGEVLPWEELMLQEVEADGDRAEYRAEMNMYVDRGVEVLMAANPLRPASERVIVNRLQRAVLNAQTTMQYRFPEAPLLDHVRIKLDGFAEAHALRSLLVALVSSQIRSVEFEVPDWLREVIGEDAPLVLELHPMGGFGCAPYTDVLLRVDSITDNYGLRPGEVAKSALRPRLDALSWFATHRRDLEDGRGFSERDHGVLVKGARSVIEMYGEDVSRLNLYDWGARRLDISLEVDPDVPVWLVMAVTKTMAEHPCEQNGECIYTIDWFGWNFGAYWTTGL